jgi:hypothetical protein
MLIKLVEIHKPEGERVYLDEIHVSPDAVTMIRKESNAQIINEAHSLGINHDVQFSQLTLVEGMGSRTIIVVGLPEELKRKLGKRQVLRG